MMSKENVTVKCDPLNPGSPEANVLKSRFLAAWAAWRGQWETHDVDCIINDIWKKGSRYDKYFPDWIPNPIASNICAAPHCELGDSVVMVSNNTCVSEVFRRVLTSWETMFNHNAYVHIFAQDG